MRDATPSSFSPARRFGIGCNVALSILALTALVVMANYLAARHFHRIQWSADQRYELTPQTLRVLAAVTNDIHVTVLFDRDSTLYPPVSGLLKEYAYVCPRIKVETVDYNRQLPLAQAIIEKHQLPQADVDMVIFEAAAQPRIIRASELSDYNLGEVLAGSKEVRRIAFRGEPLFTSAIAGLIESRAPSAYFLQGHGEHDPTSTETKFGYARFAQLLQQKNIRVNSLRLTAATDLPEDCRLLIIAGPRSRLDPSELDQISRYLSRGGRLLVLLSFYQSSRAPTGLERVLAQWGVQVGENLVFDVNNAVPGGGILCTNFTAHPVVRPLRNQAIYVVLARSVDPIPSAASSADAPRVEPLFLTSSQGYIASEMTDSGLPRHNPQRDRRGAIPLAVAVEKGSIQGVAADRGSTRLVVVGESIFLANETIVKTAANLEFASLAVNWLLDRPEYLAGIAPRPIQEHSIVLSRADLTQLRWLLLAVLPGGLLLVGILVWIRRR